MVTSRHTAVLVLVLCSATAIAADTYGDDWPAGPNRELTGAFCGSCHSLELVKQQRQSREGWDKLMTWMSKTQGMPVVTGEMRDDLLDFLETNFGLERNVDTALEDLLESDGGMQGLAFPLLIEQSD